MKVAYWESFHCSMTQFQNIVGVSKRNKVIVHGMAIYDCKTVEFIAIMPRLIDKFTIFFNKCLYRKGTSIRQAPVFSAPPSINGKAHGSLLSGWMNYNYTACCWFPTSSNTFNTSITVLTNQVWKLLIALFKVRDATFQEISWNQEISDRKKELQEKWNSVSR